MSKKHFITKIKIKYGFFFLFNLEIAPEILFPKYKSNFVELNIYAHMELYSV